ncbi:hypothetical protein U9K52_19540 [Chryseobacterium sp. MHB01]|uniref:hypothetical protein n=1 Tax=Chryseobacterium sp. MHB01 TaxID=3109433 RepID=UPI002AFDD6BA|nr:hypothetical protein [Chryseobacterium sp. MHB01]MEA1851113.1 hypothetical protein [Chryseobacterium sp. MHB01]
MKHTLNKRKTKFRLLNKKNSLNKISHTEFVSLLYIRNTNIALNKDLEEILRILKELQKSNKKSRLVFKTNCTLTKHILWETIINEIKQNLMYIKLQIEYIKENTIQANYFNYSLFWQQNKIFIKIIKENYAKLELLGNQILPKEVLQYWKTNIRNMHDEFFHLMISFLNICKMELNFIKIHSPHNLSEIIQNIIVNIPKIKNSDRLNRYEQIYIEALKNYKEEFSEKLSFWNVVLKALTINKDQSPSEQTMLERWIDGKDRRKINSI